MRTPSDSTLYCRNLGAKYDDATALSNIDLQVRPGEAVSVIGQNGSGKSTLLRAISGTLQWFSGSVSAGSVCLGEQDITRWPAHRIVGLGIGTVLSDRHLFDRMTGKENLVQGATHLQQNSSDLLEEMLSRFPDLKNLLPKRAETMSGGERQMVALGRSLISKPKVLLADEPSAGLAPGVVERVAELFDEFTSTGASILIAEQNIKFALHRSTRVYLMAEGRVVQESEADEMYKEFSKDPFNFWAVQEMS